MPTNVQDVAHLECRTIVSHPGWRRGVARQSQFGFHHWFDPGDVEGLVNPQGRRQSETHRCGIDHALHLDQAEEPGRQLPGFDLKGMIPREKPHLLTRTVQWSRDPVAIGLPLAHQDPPKTGETEHPVSRFESQGGR